MVKGAALCNDEAFQENAVRTGNPGARPAKFSREDQLPQAKWGSCELDFASQKNLQIKA
jgi:hypothetical protein